LLAIGGCEQAPNRRLSRYETAELTRWIESGGVLLVAGAHDYLWDEAGIALEAPAGCFAEGSLAAELARAERGEAPDQVLGEGFLEDPDAVVARLLGSDEEEVPTFSDPTGILAGLPVVPLASPGSIRVPEGSAAEAFLTIGKPPVPYGVIVERGEGAIVVVASGSPFQNESLAAADGGVVFARLVSALEIDGPILFDEYHLGVGERRSLGRYVRDIGGGPMILQLLFIVGVAILAFGVRFGRPVQLSAPVPGGTASFVEGIGELYARTGDTGAALALVVREALDEIAAHHHVASGDASRLAALLGERGHREAATAVARLGELAASGKIRGRQLVDHIGEIDGLVARAKGNER
jgi:hypothetical protein